MSRGKPSTWLYLETHPAGRAGTLREGGISKPHTAEAFDLPPFRVVHLAHVHPPYGMWRVLHGGHAIGQQLSRPSLDDCERLLRVASAPGQIAAYGARVVSNWNRDGWNNSIAASSRGGHSKAKGLRMRRRAA